MLIALCSLFVFHFPRCNHFPRHRQPWLFHRIPQTNQQLSLPLKLANRLTQRHYINLGSENKRIGIFPVFKLMIGCLNAHRSQLIQWANQPSQSDLTAIIDLNKGMLYIFDVNNIHMYIICVISFNLSPVKTSKGTDIFFFCLNNQLCYGKIIGI